MTKDQNKKFWVTWNKAVKKFKEAHYTDDEIEHERQQLIKLAGGKPDKNGRYSTPLFQTSDGKKSVTFIGGKVQTEISTYAFTYIVSSMRKAWKNNNDRRLKRAGFLRGYFNALYSEMPRVFRSNDLVVCHDNYIEETFYSNPLVKRGTVSETSTKGGSASAQAGYRAGKKQGIRNSLKMHD